MSSKTKIGQDELAKGVTKREYDERGGVDPFDLAEHRQAETTKRLAAEEAAMKSIRAGHAMFDAAEKTYKEHASLSAGVKHSAERLQAAREADLDDPAWLDEANQPNALTEPMVEGYIDGFIDRKEAEKGRGYDYEKPIGEFLDQADLADLQRSAISDHEAWDEDINNQRDSQLEQVRGEYNRMINGQPVRDGFIEAAIEDARENHGVEFKTTK